MDHYDLTVAWIFRDCDQNFRSEWFTPHLFVGAGASVWRNLLCFWRMPDMQWCLNAVMMWIRSFQSPVFLNWLHFQWKMIVCLQEVIFHHRNQVVSFKCYRRLWVSACLSLCYVCMCSQIDFQMEKWVLHAIPIISVRMLSQTRMRSVSNVMPALQVNPISLPHMTIRKTHLPELPSKLILWASSIDSRIQKKEFIHVSSKAKIVQMIREKEDLKIG